jgi:hypothetical protein
MKIELNGVPLQKEDDGTGDGWGVTDVSIRDLREMEVYDVPGGQGSSYQDQGRSAVSMKVKGTATGPNARGLLEGIWSCFKKGDPVAFNSDVSGAADITKVLIESLRVESRAGNRNRYDYLVSLWEYREPPEEPEAPGTVSDEAADGEAGAKNEEEAKAWAGDKAEESDQSFNELSGLVLDGDGNPAKGVTVVITGAGREIEVKTDDEGIYRADRLEPGDYRIEVRKEGYEGMGEEVSIGK